METKLRVGFRFSPTDVELVTHYLRRMVRGESDFLDLMPVIDLKVFEPWNLAELPAISCGAEAGYFFADGTRWHSERIIRVTNAGYWKSTGTDRVVRDRSEAIARIKTLVFHKKNAPKGHKTGWVMLEYSLTGPLLKDLGEQAQNTFVLCKVFKTGGFQPNKEQCGEPFDEKELLDDSMEAPTDESKLSSVTDVTCHDGIGNYFPEQVSASSASQLPNDVQLHEAALPCVDWLADPSDYMFSPAPFFIPHHAHTDATGLGNQGADLNEKQMCKQALKNDNEAEGKIHSESSRCPHGLHLRESQSSLKETLVLLGEGFEFDKEMLIQLWMALEFIVDEPMEVIGAKYFEKLVSAGYILCSAANSLYKVNTEKLNTELDIVGDNRNYIIWGNGSQANDSSTETLHISVFCDGIDGAAIFKKLEGFSRLKTLLFIGKFGSMLQQVPRDLFVRYESLVALDLSGTHIKELPSFTRKMIHLRYLDLSWTLLERLPERIDRFQGLQTLKLKGCSHLCRLPKEMKKVTELRHLDLDVLRQLIAFPKGMGALVNLHTLSAFPVGVEEGHKISELKHLNNLTGEFCIAKLENVETVNQAKEASLIAKRKIRKLELRWSRHFQGPKNEDEAILEILCPYSDLEEIQILCYHGTRLPSWIADVSFHKLVSIALLRCEYVSILPSLEKLPSLESLEFNGFSSVTKMGSTGKVGHVAFPKLQKLAIDGMPNLEETWTEAQEGDYPSLVELSIKDCPKLSKPPSLLYLPSLKNLEVTGCTNLAFLLEKELSASLQELIVEDCPLIGERCSKKEGRDWYKIQHVPTIWIDQVAVQPACKDDWEPLTEDDNDSDSSLHATPMVTG